MPIITNEDSNIASLKALIHDLNHQTTRISKEIESLFVRAREALANQNRSTALRLIKYKKLQESLLMQRGQTLLQLEGVLGQIQQAANHVEVVHVLKSSTSVLRGLSREIGGPDKVQDILDNLRDQMAETEQINEAFADNGAATATVDEAEIDSELDALEAENRTSEVEQAASELQKQLESLPDLTIKDIGSNAAEGKQKEENLYTVGSLLREESKDMHHEGKVAASPI